MYIYMYIYVWILQSVGEEDEVPIADVARYVAEAMNFKGIIYVYIFTCVRMCVCVCMWIYVYICIYMYV
jgi:hypothetical protein